MLKKAFSSLTMSVAAASTVAIFSQSAALAQSSGAAASGPPVCGSYAEPIPYPDKDYATGGPLEATYKTLLAKILATPAYTMTIVAHEEKDGATQDRTYHFSYLCPSMPGAADAHPEEARMDIVAGSGKEADPGGEALWHGGMKVRGHQGGALAHLKIIAELTDPRATSLTGRTVNTAVFADMLDHAKDFGKMTQGADQTISIKTETGNESHLCHVYTQAVDPDAQKLDYGLTSEKIFLDTTTLNPVRHEGYIGDKLVEWEDFSAINLNPGLTVANFQ